MQTFPRAAGLMYLAIIGLGLFGEAYVRGSLVASGNAAATASNILASALLWRTSIVTDLLMHVLDVPLIIFLYLLLKPVSHPLALLATLFNVVQTCTLVVNKLTLVGALSLLNAGTPVAPESAALAFFAIQLHGHGFGIGLIFFGLSCLVRSYLIIKSGYIPAFIGVLIGLAGISYLVNSFALLLSPSLAAALFPAMLLPSLVGELAFCLWLLLTKQSALLEAVASADAPSACRA
jgi:Domain of unknown function (DUF4386)